MYLLGGRIKSVEFIILTAVIIKLFSLTGCAAQNKKKVILHEEETTTLEPERKITEESLQCIACHERRGVTHGWIAGWKASRHAQKGVGCEECHISLAAEPVVKEAIEQEYLSTDGSNCEDRRVRREVIAGVCGKCHSKQYDEFTMSRHSISWKRVLDCGQDMRLSDEIRSARCEQCHNIQFKCDACHTRHSFNTFEAKKPETCRTCHMGPDHPHYDIFISSRHGTLYSASQNNESVESQSKQFIQSPLCITCHMPHGTHDVSFGLAYGPVGVSRSYIDRNGVVLDEFRLAERRGAMLSTCAMCHSKVFAENILTRADSIHKDIDTIVNEAKEIITGLEKDGLISLPVNMKIIDQYPYHAIVLGDQRQYNGKLRIYYLFADLIKNALISWKGAYHFNPNYTYLYGSAELQKDFDEIRAEASRLREEAELKRKMGIKLR